MKAALRAQFKAARAAIHQSKRHADAIAAAHLLSQQSFFNESQHIACYLPFKDEFETDPIIYTIWEAGKNCYLPVLHSHGNQSLHFILYRPDDRLVANRYGILEPINTENEIAAEMLDLVITPLIAFDMQGHRLGTGGGYYDRTFAFLHESKFQKPMMLGLGYSIQAAEHLPAERWDVNLDAILTEEKCLVF